MCMNSEAVEALHALTSELKAEHARKATWLAEFEHAIGKDARTVTRPLEVNSAEAERIFADRIAAHEARLKDLGWTRTIRVEPSNQRGNPDAVNPATHPQPMT